MEIEKRIYKVDAVKTALVAFVDVFLEKHTNAYVQVTPEPLFSSLASLLLAYRLSKSILTLRKRRGVLLLPRRWQSTQKRVARALVFKRIWNSLARLRICVRARVCAQYTLHCPTRGVLKSSRRCCRSPSPYANH